jgi:Tol biopolymer transport system component
MPDVWVIDTERGTSSRVTFERGSKPIWSPDDTKIVYDNGQDLYITSAAGTGRSELLQKTAVPPGTLSKTSGARAEGWSLDGKFLVYADIPDANIGIWILSIADRKTSIFLQTPYTESGGQFSPDGHFLAYTSNESKRDEVYIQTYPPSDAKWQISTGGGNEPRWRDDGKELFFLSLDRKLMAVDIVVTGGKLRAGIPRVLFQTPITEATRPPNVHYDVRPDGSQFIFNTPLNETTESPITAVLNWTAALKKK